MTSWVWTVFAVVLTLAALVALHRWRLRRVFMAGTRILAAQHADLQLELEAERKKTKSLREQLESAQDVAREERARADRYFEKIHAAITERDGWHDKHVQESVGHGNAQNLMMQTIEQMARLLTDKGIKYRIPRVLAEVRADFEGRFEMPARESLAEMVDKARAEVKPPEPPTAA